MKKRILAGIVGDLMGDGHLQGHPKWRMDYTSKDTTELERFNNEINVLFGYKGKIRENKTNLYGVSFNLGINNREIARYMYSLGVPAGNKVLQRFVIPAWIRNDKECFRRFAERLFTCEGCVDCFSKAIEIKMSKEVSLVKDGINFFKDIKKLLESYFGIKTTKPFLEGRKNKRKDGKVTVGVRMKIRRKESIRLFQKEIGFENEEKKRKLELIVKGLNRSG
ncbi:MAG: LAGLIDADG family homing endonuclease [Candidatus Woesearchaeota archaeon]|nr:LAGLIDADG family homing endonuclease [Candidatus Woesearchaeota archaeon]